MDALLVVVTDQMMKATFGGQIVKFISWIWKNEVNLVMLPYMGDFLPMNHRVYLFINVASSLINGGTKS